MKTKNILLILSLAFGLSLVSCGESIKPNVSSTPVESKESSNNSSNSNSIATSSTTNTSSTTTSENQDNEELRSLKSLALAKLDEIVNPSLNKLSDEDIKQSLKGFYKKEKLYVNDIKDVDTAKQAATKVVEDCKTFAIETLKPLGIEKLNEFFNPLIAKLPDESLKASVQTFYDKQIENLNDINSLDDVATLYEKVVEDVKSFITTETEKVLVDLKNKAISELDPYVNALIEKIPHETLKNDTRTFYQSEKTKLENITKIEDITPTVEEIKQDLQNYALDETKKLAIEELDKLVNAGLDKLHNEEIKGELRTFYDEEKQKINSVSELEQVQPTLTTVLDETKVFIRNLVLKTAKSYLADLFTYTTANPYQYVPEAMIPTYANNLVTSPVNDFTTNVLVSNISQQGYGEQWQMVLENLNQMLVVTKAMNVVDSSMTTLSNAMNIYIKNSPTEELNHTINNETYTAKLTFIDTKFYFEVTFKTSFNVVGIGAVQPVVKMALDIITNQKAIYISLNANNMIKYTMGTDVFELASTYGVTILGKTGSRTSYFETKKDDSGNKYGHIYEYTTFEGEDKIQACAEFYVKNGYVSVVGNKASGMIGFTGYINELYSENEGRLLGYKVQEEINKGVLSGTYHTLWFNLWDISGINSVKVTKKTSANTSDKSTVDVYINNSANLMVPTYNTKPIIGNTSRKYDIELRNRYYYDIVDGKKTVLEAKIPMMFIQDDNKVDSNYTDFTKNFKTDNNVDVSVSMDSAVLAQIRSDYETLIPVFKTNKDKMSSELIIEYLNKFN